MLATQTLRARKMKNMAVRVEGEFRPGVGAKDLALHLIAIIGTNGGAGHVIEYMGSAIRSMSMEGRMTLCNLSIEGGARAGLVAPDEKTFAYMKGRPAAPKGGQWETAVQHWQTLFSDETAHWDAVIDIAAEDVAPTITWGTSPEQAAPITATAPVPSEIADPVKREAATRALAYMGIAPGQKLEGLKIDRVFIGSCTNSRIEDLRAAADIAKGQHVAAGVRAMVVPGSGLIRAQAEEEGLDKVFLDAGFEWREPGCSMCLGMNPDILSPGRALRLHLEPQLRRPAGPRRPHPPDEPHPRRESRDRGCHHGLMQPSTRSFRSRIQRLVITRAISCCTSPLRPIAPVG